jgi:hypothetical protein
MGSVTAAAIHGRKCNSTNRQYRDCDRTYNEVALGKDHRKATPPPDYTPHVRAATPRTALIPVLLRA